MDIELWRYGDVQIYRSILTLFWFVLGRRLYRLCLSQAISSGGVGYVTGCGRGSPGGDLNKCGSEAGLFLRGGGG